MFKTASSHAFLPDISYQNPGISSSSGSESTNDELSYEYPNTYQERLPLEIDVKPKKKVFISIEHKKRFVQEYKKKVKTELCKNWEMAGWCRHGDKCSFAHGQAELKKKVHLHSNYKTKPCFQYFYQGICPYGYRCQYMHNEIKQKVEKVQEYAYFLQKAYEEKEVPINFLSRRSLGFGFHLKKIENLLSMDEKKEEMPVLLKKRLPVFKKTCNFANPSSIKMMEFDTNVWDLKNECWSFYN